jgi:hypothetical protein
MEDVAITLDDEMPEGALPADPAQAVPPALPVPPPAAVRDPGWFGDPRGQEQLDQDEMAPLGLSLDGLELIGPSGTVARYPDLAGWES